MKNYWWGGGAKAPPPQLLLLRGPCSSTQISFVYSEHRSVCTVEIGNSETTI